MASGSSKGIEVKVGALILISLALLFGFIVVMGGLTFAHVFTLYVDFDNPSGLQIGAPVKIAGVKVGTVDDLEYRGGKPDPRVPWRALVRVRLSVQSKVHDSIHEDAQFVITTQGVLGEPFIAIQPGDPSRPVLPAESIRQGKDPPRLDVFLAQASEMLTVAYDAMTKPDGTIQQLGRHGLSLVKNLDVLLVENRETINRIIRNTEKLTAEASELARSAREKVDGPQLQRIIDNVDTTAAALAKDTGPLLEKSKLALAHLDEIATETLGPAQRESLRKTIADVQLAAHGANKTLTDVQGIITHVKSGKGSVGALVMDDALYDDVQEMLRDLKHNPWKLFWKE